MAALSSPWETEMAKKKAAKSNGKAKASDGAAYWGTIAGKKQLTAQRKAT